MLLQSAGQQPRALPDTKRDALHKAPGADLGLRIAKYRDHFIGVLTPVRRWIQVEQRSVETEHSSQASLRAMRRAASLVRCLIRSISSCRLRRPRDVSR